MSGSFNRDPIVAGYTSVHKCGHHRPAAAATAAAPAAPGWKAGRGIPGLPPVDSKGLEAVLARLVGMGSNMVTVVWSAMEEVSTEAILL